MRALTNQTVGYVLPAARKGAPVKVVKATVLESFADGSVHLDYSEGEPGTKNFKEKRAYADFNEDKKTENSWHPIDEETEKAAPSSGK